MPVINSADAQKLVLRILEEFLSLFGQPVRHAADGFLLRGSLSEEAGGGVNLCTIASRAKPQARVNTL